MYSIFYLVSLKVPPRKVLLKFLPRLLLLTPPHPLVWIWSVYKCVCVFQYKDLNLVYLWCFQANFLPLLVNIFILNLLLQWSLISSDYPWSWGWYRLFYSSPSEKSILMLDNFNRSNKSKRNIICSTFVHCLQVIDRCYSQF